MSNKQHWTAKQKALIVALKCELDERRNIGCQLSNVLFNTQQGQSTPQEINNMELVRKWDAIKRVIGYTKGGHNKMNQIQKDP